MITSDSVDTAAAQMKEDVDVEGLMWAGREVRVGAGREIVISAHPSDTVAETQRMICDELELVERATVFTDVERQRLIFEAGFAFIRPKLKSLFLFFPRLFFSSLVINR